MIPEDDEQPQVSSLLQSQSAGETLPLQSAYERRRINEGDRWKGLHDDLIKARIESSSMPPNQCCVKCLAESDHGKQTEETSSSTTDFHDVARATMRCLDCGPHQYFCRYCTETIHKDRNYFHVVEVWKVQ